MRKVYQTPNNTAGVAAAIAIGAGMAGLLFCVLPFSHLVNKRSDTVSLRKMGTAELPPTPPEDVAPPPKELERPPEAPPEPQLADTPQAVPLSADLEVAAGAGGVLAGFGEIRSLTAAQAVEQ